MQSVQALNFDLLTEFPEDDMQNIPMFADPPDFQPVNVQIELPEKIIHQTEICNLDLFHLLRHAIMKEMGVDPAYSPNNISIVNKNASRFYQPK